MSAIRLPRRDEEGNVSVALIDPYTRQVFTPQPLPVHGSGPVEVVQPATSAPRPRPVRQLLTDDEIHARHVKGGKAVAAINKARREARA